MPTRFKQMIFIADFIAYSTCFGHHYAHHQELESIIQMGAACGIWCFGFQVVGLVWSWGLCVRFAGSDHLYNILELMMMGIMVPETCWASNKICNKYHLLHLVGILFPHIEENLCITLVIQQESSVVVMFEYLAAVPYYFTLPVNHFLLIFIFNFESRWWRGFPHWSPHNLLYYRYRVSFPGAKPSGRGVDIPPLSKAEVKKWVELFLYFPPGPSWHVLGWTWPFYLHRSRSGVDGIVFRLWTIRSGVWIQVGEGRFSLLQIRPCQPPIEWVLGLFPGGKTAVAWI